MKNSETHAEREKCPDPAQCRVPDCWEAWEHCRNSARPKTRDIVHVETGEILGENLTVEEIAKYFSTRSYLTQVPTPRGCSAKDIWADGILEPGCHWGDSR
jgi:hypothetical protein